MKIKFIAVLTALAVLFAAVPFSASETDGYAMTMEVASVTGEPVGGATVQVPVNLTANTGYLAGTLTVIWDPQALCLAGVEFTDLGPDDGCAAIDDADRAGGSYRMQIGHAKASEDGGNIEGTGLLFTLSFTVAEGAEEGDYAVTIRDTLFLDFDVDAPDITVNTVDGTVTLKTFVPEPTEPATEAPTQPATEPVTEAPTEPATEPVTEAPTEPATEPATEAPTVPATEAPTILLGDADGDDNVAVLDATAIQRTLAALPVPVFIEAAADVDRDKDITVLDATYIQRWLAAIDVDYPIGERVAIS